MPVELSVIIVNHNGRGCLPACLSSLERERAGGHWEILVVDNASRDGSADIVEKRFPRVRLVRSAKNVGFAAANNLGLKKTRGEYVLFLNPDTRVFPGAPDFLLRAMKADPGIGAAGPALLAAEGAYQVSFGGRVGFFRELARKCFLNGLRRRRLRSARKPREVVWASGACLLARREVLENIGGFDEGFFLYFEDIDLCYRLREAGYKIVFLPEARVFHAGGISASAASRRSRLEYRRSQVRFYEKHNSRLSLLMLKAYQMFAPGPAAVPARGRAAGRKIRVLEVIDKPFLGGGQRTVLLLAAGLGKRGFEVAVCSAAGGPLVAELERRGVEHHPLPLGKMPNPGAARKLRRLIREGDFDVVHTHGGVAGLYGRLAARGTRAAAVHTLHGIHYLHYSSPILRRAFIALERWMSRSTAAVVCVSLADRARAAALGLAPEEKLRVIKNGIDFKEGVLRGTTGRRRREPWSAGTGPVVGTVARLHRQKGLAFLLRAVPAVLRAHPRARFVIVGGGPLAEKLAEETARLGAGAAVHFLGERPDVADILARFDVFVLPSLWEGLPYVLGEAARAGKPVVASDIEGVREVIHDGENGLLVTPADPGALASAVNRLLGDAALRRRLAAASRRTVPGHFDLGMMLRLTGSLYRELETTYNRYP
jgi:GT2 family glycosyltransferase